MATRSSKHAPAAVDFKGRMATLTVVRVNETDISRVLACVDGHLARSPGFFSGMPMVLEGEALATIDGEHLRGLRDALGERGLSVVGVTGDAPADEALAAAGMARLRVGAGAAPEPARERPEPEVERAAGTAVTPQQSRVVTQPVRSGQQIYARGGDLIVLASVSPGAEVLADGHVHIYGSLNGRALAGVRGDRAARIFCRRFDPELVAIAGHYQVSENIADGDRGRDVQICLDHEALTIAPLAMHA